MIIWLNGAFGAGKTTIAKKLQEQLKDAFIYDPEELGDFFRVNLPKEMQQNDFQDYPEWRDWNVHIIEKIAREYKGNVIIPMTIYKTEAFKMVEQLKKSVPDFYHFQLEVSRNQVMSRLQTRPAHLISWGEKHLDGILTDFEKIPKEEKVVNEGKTVEEVVGEILARVN